jgi:hypothetical protein
MEEEVTFTASGFDAVSLIRKAQVDTILDSIQLIVRLAGAPGITENEKKDAEHLVMRLQTMLRVI